LKCNHLQIPIQDVIKCSENTENLRKTKISDKHLILTKLYISDPSSLFKSFDFVIKGKVPFPRQNVEFFRYETIIPVGPIPMELSKLL
jgi:hypothetical protein